MNTFRLLVSLVIVSCIGGPALAENRILNEQGLGNVFKRRQADIIQVNVPSQAGASCAYHALFNGLAIKALMTLSGDALKQAYADIQAAARRNDKFGPVNSPWRSLIAQERVKEQLRRQLVEQIALSLKGAQLLQPGIEESNIYLQKLPNGKRVIFKKLEDSWFEGQLKELFLAISIVANNFVEDRFDASTLSIDISAADIKQALLKRIQYRVKTVENIDTLVHDLELNSNNKLDEYFDFQDTVVEGKADTADWLFPDELEKIIATYGLDNGAPVFHVAANLDGANRLATDVELTTNPTFQKFMTDFQDPHGTATGIFLIYSGGKADNAHKKSSDSSYYASATNGSTQGHWYCMVANKVDGKRQYVLADSMGNPSRLDHGRFRELKALLEGVPDVPVSPPKKQYRRFDANAFFGYDQLYGTTAYDLGYQAGSNNNTRLPYLTAQAVMVGCAVTAFVTSLLCYKYLANRRAAYVLRNKPIIGDALPDAVNTAV